MMRADMNWTSHLGNAFLSQPQDVMDAVQRMRRQARDYGYLRSNGQVIVGGSGPYIEIMPVNPGYMVVPYYDPLVVYARPRPGIVVAGGGINFGFGVAIGTAFRPWGWGGNRFGWTTHTVIVNNRGWDQRRVNRTGGPALVPAAIIDDHRVGRPAEAIASPAPRPKSRANRHAEPEVDPASRHYNAGPRPRVDHQRVIIRHHHITRVYRHDFDVRTGPTYNDLPIRSQVAIVPGLPPHPLHRVHHILRLRQKPFPSWLVQFMSALI